MSSVLAQAPNVNYSGSLVITQGGTYSGNFRSNDANVAVIRVETTQPVIIENSILAGVGNLIFASNNATLTVRNCSGYSLPQTSDNVRHGRFLEANYARSLTIDNNYLEQTTGISVYLWGGNGTASQTLKVRYNKVKNIDGRLRGGGVQYANFLGLNTVRNLVGAEVAWNEVINEPNKSLVEDNINFFNSSGVGNSHLLVHNNYIQGAYPFPATSSSYTGSGLITDGDGNDSAPAFIDAYRNQFVSTCAAINIAAGHDNHFFDNRVVTSGLLPDGSRLAANYAGAGLWNAYNKPSNIFFNNDMKNNYIGFQHQGGRVPYVNRQDTSPGACATCTETVHMPDRPLTLADEQNEWTLWQQKIQQNGIKIGPGGSSTPTPAPNPTPTPTPTPTPAPTPTPTPTPTTPALVRAINLNGAAATVDGRVFEASAGAANFQASGVAPWAAQNVALSPATDAARTQLIRSMLYGRNTNLAVGGLASGTYSVYLYVWEDNYPETFSIGLEGATVKANHNSGAAGQWQRLGPFTAPVTDGTLNLTTTGGDANLSAIEIWK